MGGLKIQLLPALEPLEPSFPAVFPKSSKDVELYEAKAMIEGADASEDAGVRSLADDEKKTVRALGWSRWEKVFVRCVQAGVRCAVG